MSKRNDIEKHFVNKPEWVLNPNVSVNDILEYTKIFARSHAKQPKHDWNDGYIQAMLDVHSVAQGHTIFDREEK